MPVRPERKPLYPSDWPQISHRRKVAAGWCCETCGVHNLAWGWRRVDGSFVPLDAALKQRLQGRGLRPPFRTSLEDGIVVDVIEIVLAVGHIDQDESNCADSNLRCWCQACHNRHDAQFRVRNRMARARLKMATGDLFVAAS